MVCTEIRKRTETHGGVVRCDADSLCRPRGQRTFGKRERKEKAPISPHGRDKSRAEPQKERANGKIRRPNGKEDNLPRPLWESIKRVATFYIDSRIGLCLY